MTYKELKGFYEDYFVIGHLNVDITEKFALIALICHVVKGLKRKKPDVTYYKVVYKLCENSGFPEEFINGLAIICEDFAKGSKEFPTFNLKGKEITAKIREILNSYLPF